jgi:hypothetical protein
VALAGTAGIAGASAPPGPDAAPRPADSGQARPARPPFATRAESLRLARRLLARAVLPPGTHRFRGRKVPSGLRWPAGEPSATDQVDVHRVFTERRSMRGAIAFLEHHWPAGWSSDGTGDTYTIAHGKKVITEESVAYAPRHIRPAFSAIQLLVEVVPGRHGHALSRVDVQVIWYPRRSAAEYLIARHYRAVRIDEWIYGTQVRHVRRTFRQRAIIDKLTRVVNSVPASPGGVWHCPLITRTYQFTFKPVTGRPDAVLKADGCGGYQITIGDRSQPALAENGKIEVIARNLMRGSH